MSQRERPAAGGLMEAAPRSPHAPAGPAAAGPVTDPAALRVPSWEELFNTVSPAQQQELLGLADKQGLLYAHQLPAAPRGSLTDRNRQFLMQVLAGHTEDLVPVSVQPVIGTDPDLDSVQREAVARALATPDLFLVQGLPGTGKSRVVAEIITQATARGERVLLLAPNTAALDRTLELVAERDEVCAVRCLARDERSEASAPAIAGLTFAEKVRRLRDQAQAAARRQLERGEQNQIRHRQDEGVYDRLAELAETWRQLEEQAAASSRRREQIPAETAAEAQAVETPAVLETGNGWIAGLRSLIQAQQESCRCLETDRAGVARQTAERRQELDGWDGQITALRPLAAAKEEGKWWTQAWWKATLSGNVATRLQELTDGRQRTADALDELERENQRLEQETAKAEANWQAERGRLVAAEVARRLAAVDDQQAALHEEQKLVQDKWQMMLRQLAADSPRPAALTAAALQEARQALVRLQEHDERQITFARQWAETLPQALAGLEVRLVGYSNLVASTLVGIGNDEHFGDGTPHGQGFDLLILDHAQEITEAEFFSAARRARRWILVGEPAGDGEAANSHPAPRHAEAGPRSSRPTGRPATPALRPGFFQRLWQHLHHDPRRWPYAWERENGRLCCRLRAVPDDQRQWLETEHVADFPAIELRILARPRTEPVLAEVLFPPAMTIGQAKEYIFKELQELPIQASCRALHWVEETDRLILRLAESRLDEVMPVDLAPGVRELVGPVVREAADPPVWRTCCLEFDRRAGWQRAQAEEWLQLHLRFRDLGRTVRLDVPYRMQPGLARFVADVLADLGYRNPVGEADAVDAIPVIFVPVPPPQRDNPRPAKNHVGGPARSNAARPNSRGGAGLELDLADSRHRDRLPSELRPQLPQRGLVNYLEAQAVVRSLTALAAEAPSGNGKPLDVGVIALYAAQAELIRLLIAQTPALAASGLAIRVDTPAGLRERDCAVVLVSLTRSHSHRAVSFGENPDQLVLALTRARRQLILIGDPGTLARRSQWEGPVDHLDAPAAAHERHLIGQLVHYLHGHGRYARLFRLREGTAS